MFLPFLLTACSDNDGPDGETRERHVIEFARPFVSHASRSEVTSENLSAFSVYCYLHKSGGAPTFIYNGETVTRGNGDVWNCDKTEYWYPGFNYYFTGIAPIGLDGLQFEAVGSNSDTVDGGGIITYDIDPSRGQADVVYAFESVNTDDNRPLLPVEMEFDHQLAKVEFEFYNDLINPRLFINVNWIQIDGAVRRGTIDKTDSGAVWQPAGSEATWIGVGSVPLIHTDKPSVSAPVFLLPISRDEMTITVKTQVFESHEDYGNEGFELTKEESLQVPFPAINMQPGRCYRLICHLRPSNVEGSDGPLRPISFSVEENPWTDMTPETP